jgi:hypothetical protein
MITDGQFHSFDGQRWSVSRFFDGQRAYKNKMNLMARIFKEISEMVKKVKKVAFTDKIQQPSLTWHAQAVF